MATAASHGIRDKAKETVRDMAGDAREAMNDIGKAASDASGDFQSDLQALREDFNRLANQVADILSNRGNAAWQRARSQVDDAIADAQDRGREGVEAMREVSDHFIEAVEESIKTRPYATIAMAAGLGFLFGVIWRR